MDKTNIKFNLMLSAPEYLALHEVARREGCTMGAYIREALAQRYNAENPTRLGFTEDFRVRQPPL